jgi:hypothetical protein
MVVWQLVHLDLNINEIVTSLAVISLKCTTNDLEKDCDSETFVLFRCGLCMYLHKILHIPRHGLYIDRLDSFFRDWYAE